MYGNQYRPPSQKRPLGRTKRMGKGKGPSGAYQAGYDAALRQMKSRKAGKKAQTYNTQRGDAERPTYGEDQDNYGNQRYTPRIGWRF